MLSDQKKRKSINSANITIEQIRDAYQTVAVLVAKFGDAYLPVFERLHHELKVAEQKSGLRILAKQIDDELNNIT